MEMVGIVVGSVHLRVDGFGPFQDGLSLVGHHGTLLAGHQGGPEVEQPEPW